MSRFLWFTVYMPFVLQLVKRLGAMMQLQK